LRVGWNAVLAHAYSRVSQEISELRDVYVARPVAYVYRHPEPVVSLTIHRRDANGQDRLIWARISSPHALSLRELQSKIDHFCDRADPGSLQGRLAARASRTVAPKAQLASADALVWQETREASWDI
jgi:hypothetical protein